MSEGRDDFYFVLELLLCFAAPEEEWAPDFEDDPFFEAFLRSWEVMEVRWRRVPDRLTVAGSAT